MKFVRAYLLLIALTFLISSVLYPLVVLGIGQTLFPSRAEGDIVTGPDGKPVGARLIAQSFTKPEWFTPRPSAVSYSANASGGSNWGASNPKLRERVEATMLTRTEKFAIPADAVTTSGSGLDPHITLANAHGQLNRVATAWATKTGRDVNQVQAEIESLLNENVFEPMAGLAGGEPLVNVLELNLEMHRRLNR